MKASEEKIMTPIFAVNAILFAINLLCPIYLIRQGTFIRANAFRLVYFTASVYFILALFMFQHYPYITEMKIAFSCSLLLLAVFYLIHFLRKKNKAWFDYLKMLWVPMYFSGIVFHLFHIGCYEIFYWGATIPMLILFIYFNFFFEPPKQKFPLQ